MTDPLVALLDGVRGRLAHFDDLRLSPSPTMAPTCSVFSFTGLDELLVSRLIAWLLAPDGSHAQGARFLHAFCDRHRIARPPHRRLRVELEVPTNLIDRIRRRIDVCVLDDDWSLGIENKPVAGFQNRQLADYLDQLRRRSPSNATLVVLKGWEGDLPADQMKEAGMREALRDGSLVNVDYADVQLWLAECAGLSEASYVTSLIDDLRSSLQRWLSGGMDMERQRIVVGSILDDDLQRDAALELLASTDHLLASLSDRFVRDLHRELAPTRFRIMHGAAATRIDLPRKEYIDLELDEALPFKFSIAFDKANLRLPYVGLRPRLDTMATGRIYARLRRELAAAGLPSQTSYLEWWFWWTYTSRQRFGFEHDDTIAVWQSLGSGAFARNVVDVVEDLHDRLGGIGALDWASFSRSGTGSK
ncbi:PD-(D/E)XK nuclease family protein [Sphingomonas sp. ZB1N12]|uniref:PD-(D/E)XK nuclease family protein n=1 Tax=Sphingomonas arabinosi TaxID=3096160 RepID=UPI002FCCA226